MRACFTRNFNPTSLGLTDNINIADNAEGAAEQAEDSASGDSQTEESEVDQNLEDELGTEAE